MNRITAPESPTTDELLTNYTLSPNGIANVAQQRSRLSEINNGRSDDLIAVIGACTMTEQVHYVANEAFEIGELNNSDGLLAIVRAVPSKSRTNPANSYNGLETVSPSLAMGLMTSIASDSTGVGVAMEIIHDYHPQRYGHLLAMGWFGARTSQTRVVDLASQFLAANPDATAPVKNDLSGEVEPAIALVDTLNSLHAFAGRVSFLIYRGGENAQTPEAWEAMYRKAYALTDGKLIVDTAHGSEMAHHPRGQFRKSVDGQIEALEHVIELEREGLRPMGVLIEGSDQEHIVDPNMPLQRALDGVLRLSGIAA